MKKKNGVRIIPSAFIVFSAAVVLAGVPAGAQTLSGDAILVAWSDKPLDATLANGSRMKLLFRRDGTVEASGAAADKGAWTRRPDGYCTKWNRFNRGEERCFTVQRRSDGGFTVRNSDGSLSAEVDPPG